MKLNVVHTDFLNIEKGVLRGDTASPFIFSLFLSDFERYLIEHDCYVIMVDPQNEIVILAFTDDIVLLGTTPWEVNKKLKVFLNYCQLYHLVINTTKTKILHFSNSRKQIFNFF